MSKVKLECENCKKIFWRFPSQILFKKNYCSRKCSWEMHKKTQSGEKNPNWKGGLIKKECEQCHKTFFVKRHAKAQAYCSYSCHGLAKRGRGRLLNYIEKNRLEKYGIAYNTQNKNLLSFGTGAYMHELAKFTVCFILRKRNHEIYTEAPVKNGVADVVDMTDRIIYEVQTQLHPSTYRKKFGTLLDKKFFNDVIIIGIGEFSKDQVEEMQKKIAFKMGEDWETLKKWK